MTFRKGFPWLSIPLYIIDQITKWLIVRNFDLPNAQTGYYDQISVIPGFFHITRVHNTGVAFGRFNGTAYANPIFVGVAVIALGVIALLWRKNAFPTWPSRLAVFLLIPGVLGNLTDRLVHGYVVDFLDFDLQFYRWPSFNVADSCICVAAVLLFISAWITPTKPQAATA